METTTNNQIVTDPTDELFAAVSDVKSEAAMADDKPWHESGAAVAVGTTALILGTLMIANKLSGQ